MYYDCVLFIGRVVEYIETHLDEKLDLDQIAAAVGYSKFYLHRLFADTTGLTIHDYMIRRKLTESARLLVLSDKPIIEIALQCGYESQQAFSVAFKSMYKLSPSQFRFRGDFYPLQLPWKLDGQLGKNMSFEPTIRHATIDDLGSWMVLMRLVVDGYPHMDESEYYYSIRSAIMEMRAIVLYDGKILVGALSFSGDSGAIEFLGVHPLYRKYGIHSILLNVFLDEYSNGKEISMTTFRAGDKADTGYRRLLTEFGFEERELLMEYEYPTQRMVYKLENDSEDLL